MRRGPTNALKCFDRSANTASEPRILLVKADVTDAFRNVKLAPDQAQMFCYMVDDVLVVDVRLTFDWAGSLGHWRVMSELPHIPTVTLL